MKKKKVLLFTGLFFVACLSLCVSLMINNRKMSLVDMNVEALGQYEGGIRTNKCYLKISGTAGNQGNSINFCDIRTTDGYIYECPLPSNGFYSDYAVDRCIANPQ